ncbi:diguanylate cyclase [Shewanella psychromarinicola]|uniref:Diguanylate cyclase n=1 Tax=Shewanella psychromarinicola TaxID=2487742 RepID=A0A3N4E5T5_9GAMM|nr:diguanylate cyclase [Shewanella psychromarinicola]RPA32198.1 diguanylate cyclase [Shewanella psychromarinicola]
MPCIGLFHTNFHIINTNQSIKITASISNSTLTDGDCSMKDRFSRADKALYCAKRGGRNQIQQAQTR